jgi:hypothetical protein
MRGGASSLSPDELGGGNDGIPSSGVDSCGALGMLGNSGTVGAGSLGSLGRFSNNDGGGSVLGSGIDGSSGSRAGGVVSSGSCTDG